MSAPVDVLAVDKKAANEFLANLCASAMNCMTYGRGVAYANAGNSADRFVCSTTRSPKTGRATVRWGWNGYLSSEQKTRERVEQAFARARNGRANTALARIGGAL